MSQKENEPSKSFFASVFSFDFCSSRPKTSEIQVNTVSNPKKLKLSEKRQFFDQIKIHLPIILDSIKDYSKDSKFALKSSIQWYRNHLFLIELEADDSSKTIRKAVEFYFSSTLDALEELLKTDAESADNGVLSEIAHHNLNLLFNLYNLGEVKIEAKIHKDWLDKLKTIESYIKNIEGTVFLKIALNMKHLSLSRD